MSYSINNHLLSGVNVTQSIVSGKTSGQFKAGLPDTLVIHFTGGSSAASSVAHLSSPDVKASAHVVIGAGGEIYQLVPFNLIAWHAGESRWNGRNGLNHYSIGIELDNPGRLKPAGSDFISEFGRRYAANDVIQARHRNESEMSYWHVYTPQLIDACFDLCRELVKAYGINTIVGHEEIAPGRKSDPGPAFPLDSLREQLLQGRGDDPVVLPPVNSPVSNARMQVTATKLNVRQFPSPSAPLATAPLLKGVEVVVLERSNGWCKISNSPQSWVSGDYLRKL